MIAGKYVKRFADASHAIPIGMHMNADYPFMLPRIIANDGQFITLQSDRSSATAKLQIHVDRRGQYVWIEQSSSFEHIYQRRPKRFRCEPFKDERMPACPVTGSLFEGSRS